MQSFHKTSEVLAIAGCVVALTGCASDQELEPGAEEQATPAILADQLLPSPWGPVHISVLPPPGFANVWKVLDIRQGSLAPNGVANLWAMRETGNIRNQQWRVEPLGNDVYRLTNALSGLCLTGNLGSGSAVVQYDCDRRMASQKWGYVGEPRGWGMLQNQLTGLCLDVTGASFNDGVPLQSWDCNGQWNQRWNIW
jgi:hypothetical protein